MLPKPSLVSGILHPSRVRINATHTPNQVMGQRGSMPQQRTPPTPLTRRGGKIQEVCGVFLFLARGVNGGLLPALSAVASQQANPMEQMIDLCNQFLDHMASQDKAILTYKAMTWFWWSTVTPLTYLNQRHAAAQADTCLWQEETTYQQLMGPT